VYGVEKGTQMKKKKERKGMTREDVQPDGNSITRSNARKHTLFETYRSMIF